MNVALEALIGILCETTCEDGVAVIRDVEFRGGSTVRNQEGGGGGTTVGPRHLEATVRICGADADVAGRHGVSDAVDPRDIDQVANVELI